MVVGFGVGREREEFWEKLVVVGGGGTWGSSLVVEGAWVPGYWLKKEEFWGGRKMKKREKRDTGMYINMSMSVK